MKKQNESMLISVVKMRNSKKMASKFAITLMAALCFSGCKKEIAPGAEDLATSGKEDGLTSADYGQNIMCTNNNNNRLELFNYGDTNWNDASSVRWSWMPSTSNGYTASQVSLWTSGDPTGDPMDAKRVKTNVWPGVTEVAIAAGGQLGTIVTYMPEASRGQELWTVNCGAGSYPHAVELLPNGNLAVAAAHGDWIKVYDTSGGGGVATFPLVGAHGAVWDEEIHRLWVVGDTKLTALVIGGPRASPTLTEDVSRTKTIPGNGHDLSRYEDDNNRLWVTNSNHVYYYTKNDKQLHNAPGSAYRTTVKSISNNNSSTGYQIVETRPNTAVCTLNTWCTPTVDFYTNLGALQGTRTRTGAAFYKADVWNYDTSPAPAMPVANGKYRIENVLTTKPLCVLGGSVAIGASIVQDTYIAGDDNFEWNITKIGTTGYYRISNVNSGKDMTVINASWTLGQQIVTGNYLSSAPNNDEWKIVDLGSGKYKIESRLTGLVLNVEGASTADDTHIIQYSYTAVPQSQFTFTLVP